MYLGWAMVTNPSVARRVDLWMHRGGIELSGGSCLVNTTIYLAKLRGTGPGGGKKAAVEGNRQVATYSAHQPHKRKVHSEGVN